MNIKSEQIPDEVVEAAVAAWLEHPDVGSVQSMYSGMAYALAAAMAVLLGEPVAWTEKDGEEWVVYDADSDVGQHILHYQKDMHFIRVFPIFSFRTQDTPNADQ